MASTAGRMVVLMDDEDRENEGDLVMAAAHAAASDINFMARFGRGLICLTLTQERCQQLALPLMSSDVHRRLSTAFTVSIEAAEGVTTGISAADRAATASRVASQARRQTDGHRHARARVPADGEEGRCARARRPHRGRLRPRAPRRRRTGGGDLRDRERRRHHGAAAAARTIRRRARPQDQHHRRPHPPPHRARIHHQRVGECRLPTDYGKFRVVAYHDDIGDTVHLALVRASRARTGRHWCAYTYRKACSICLPTCTAPATGRWRARWRASPPTARAWW